MKSCKVKSTANLQVFPNSDLWQCPTRAPLSEARAGSGGRARGGGARAQVGRRVGRRLLSRKDPPPHKGKPNHMISGLLPRCTCPSYPSSLESRDGSSFPSKTNRGRCLSTTRQLSGASGFRERKTEQRPWWGGGGRLQTEAQEQDRDDPTRKRACPAERLR